MPTFSRIALLLVLIFLAGAAVAQTTNARLTGTITDSAGAVVPAATITVTNVGTQRVETATSDSSGDYVFASLPPAEYVVEVKVTGFKTIKQNITLAVQQIAALNLTLQPGQVTENVTVTADVSLVESASSNISDVVTGRQITELPLNGRNLTQLATLIPGVTRGQPAGQATGSGNNSETFRYNGTGGASLSVNGLRPQNNNFLLDGVDNNESLVNTIIFFPPADAIQEFRVDTSVAPAEFGRGSGVINSTFRSGTNQWHGSAFEFHRNSVLDAKPTFQFGSKPPFHRNQFGGSLGGALIKNKLFIFGDYQGWRESKPQGQDTATVPTDLMKQGDFSELLQLATPVVIRDPVTVDPQPGNVIPGGEILTPGQNYLNLFPEPNVPASSNLCAQATTTGICIQKNFVITRQNIKRFNDFDIRADYNLSDKDLLFARYSYGNEWETTTSRLPKLPAGFGSGDQANYPRSVAIGETRTFSPSVVNEFRFGWIRTKFGYTPPFDSVPLSEQLGIPNANTLSILGGGALIGGNGNQIEYTGDYGPYLVPQQTWQFSDSVSWVKKNHTFKFGAQILRRQMNLFRPLAGKGFFNLFGDGNGSPTGYEVSDLLSGWVNNYSVGPALGFSHTRSWENGMFVQDDWKVSRRLTLNLGLRYDIFTWPQEENNLQANFNPASGAIILPGQSGYSKALIDTPYHNFGPRIGFAYDLTGSGKSVVRGGFGMFYFLDRGGIDNQLAQNPPFSGQSSFSYGNGFRINLQGQAPPNSTDPTLAGTVDMPSKGPLQVDLANPANVSVVGYPKNDKTSYVYQWNLQYQRELGTDMAISVGYVGTEGVDLMTLLDLNRVPYNGTTSAYPSLSDVSFMGTIGRSYYNALQTRLEKRLRRGLQYSLSYTWAHTIDNSPDPLDSAEGHKYSTIADPTQYSRERANSNLDIRHSFVATSIYELPFGKGKQWGTNWSGVVQAIGGGWQVNPIVTFQTGVPFDVTINGIYGQNSRPDVTGAASAPNHINQWFDTSAYQPPPPGGAGFARSGNSPRNPYHGPGRQYMDFSIFKNFAVGERVNMQFRTQFYNITNTPQLSQPDGNFSDGNFGKITNTLLDAERQIEFGLRFTF
ncbi:MAG: TonB-dependent receptor [Acidobacteriia bacterium]|nr:TonB-dependent receptor [Terriglobia bacterium]